MVELASESAPGDVDSRKAAPVALRENRRDDDLRDTAARDVAVIAHAAPVLDAVKPVRHRLHDVDVEALRERGALVRQTLRIEVDTRKVGPEAVRRPVDGR